MGEEKAGSHTLSADANKVGSTSKIAAVALVFHALGDIPGGRWVDFDWVARTVGKTIIESHKGLVRHKRWGGHRSIGGNGRWGRHRRRGDDGSAEFCGATGVGGAAGLEQYVGYGGADVGRGGEHHKGERQGRDGFRADNHRYLLKGGL